MRPFSHRFSFAECCNASIPPRVSRLLGGGGPVAVVLAVALGVVSAIDAVKFAWSWPHVAKECGEVVSPFVANGDSATAVSAKAGEVLVVASTNDTNPNLVLCGFGQSVFSSFFSTNNRDVNWLKDGFPRGPSSLYSGADRNGLYMGGQRPFENSAGPTVNRDGCLKREFRGHAQAPCCLGVQSRRVRYNAFVAVTL